MSERKRLIDEMMQIVYDSYLLPVPCLYCEEDNNADVDRHCSPFYDYVLEPTVIVMKQIRKET